MSETFEFYDARRLESEHAAQNAVLDNVRQRELRSATVFGELAALSRAVASGRPRPIERSNDGDSARDGEPIPA